LENIRQYEAAIPELQDVPADNPRLTCGLNWRRGGVAAV